MNEVHLHGDLAERFGNVFKLEVETAAEAVRCLDANFPGEFRSALREGSFYIIRELADGSFALDTDTLHLGMSGSKLHIIPALEGAGENGGAVKVVIGIALIASALLIPGMAFGIGMIEGLSAVTFAGVSFGAIGMAGLGIALGGVAMMLAPGVGHGESAKNDQSSLVGGGVGVVQEGDAVQCVWGRMMVTPKPVASQIVTEQVQVGNGNFQYGGNPDPVYIGNNGDYINLYN